jgi:hypothetical protein
MLALGIQGLGSFVCLILFVWIVAPRSNPLTAIALAWRRAWSVRGGRLAIGAVSIVIAANYVEGYVTS